MVFLKQGCPYWKYGLLTYQLFATILIPGMKIHWLFQFFYIYILCSNRSDDLFVQLHFRGQNHLYRTATKETTPTLKNTARFFFSLPFKVGYSLSLKGSSNNSPPLLGGLRWVREMSIFRYEVRIRSQTLKDIVSQQTFSPMVEKK